ncbi:MAG: hypothetical protein BWY79_01792 [Actinobacteria bacterium ADurb.Bin444]|nr:MAG: hypothetical protein BWY79_01792 [Actinobacteria bacterium ADurb.Bin444]
MRAGSYGFGKVTRWNWCVQVHPAGCGKGGWTI